MLAVGRPGATVCMEGTATCLKTTKRNGISEAFDTTFPAAEAAREPASASLTCETRRCHHQIQHGGLCWFWLGQMPAQRPSWTPGGEGRSLDAATCSRPRAHPARDGCAGSSQENLTTAKAPTRRRERERMKQAVVHTHTREPYSAVTGSKLCKRHRRQGRVPNAHAERRRSDSRDYGRRGSAGVTLRKRQKI